MEDLRILGLNISAVTFNIINDINPFLSTMVLAATFVYTLLGIRDRIRKNNEKNK